MPNLWLSDICTPPRKNHYHPHVTVKRSYFNLPSYEGCREFCKLLVGAGLFVLTIFAVCWVVGVCQ